jgi:hypothetical protein
MPVRLNEFRAALAFRAGDHATNLLLFAISTIRAN